MVLHDNEVSFIRFKKLKLKLKLLKIDLNIQGLYMSLFQWTCLFSNQDMLSRSDFGAVEVCTVASSNLLQTDSFQIISVSGNCFSM